MEISRPFTSSVRIEILVTMWSGKLDGVDEEQLRQQLSTETDAKAVKRLTSALLYGQGKLPPGIPHRAVLRGHLADVDLEGPHGVREIAPGRDDD